MQSSIEAWRHRVRKWKQQLRHRRRKHPHLMKFLKFLFILCLIAIAEILILFLLALAGQLGLLDLRTIVSVAVTEVGISIFLYYLLGGHRRESLDEIVNLMDACVKFSHLQVFTYHKMSFHHYYVINTITKQAYEAPDFIENVVDKGIFEVITCKNHNAMMRKLRKDNIKFNEYEASFADLSNLNSSNRKP